ncbi:MAG: TolB protein [Chlamydiales bacterium]|jgi:TolB protein
MLRILCSTLITCASLLCTLLNAEEAGGTLSDRSEMVIRLATDSKLAPIYVAPLYLENAGLDGLYLNELEAIVKFDLNFNGKTQLVQHSEERRRQASTEKFDGYYDRAAWHGMNVLYVAKLQIIDKKLSASIFSVSDYNIKSITDLALTGDMSLDRRRIHQLMDSLHRAFFDEKGISNTRMLYSVRIKKEIRDSTKWVSEIWECDYDGGNARQITNEGGVCVTPSYLPPKPGFASGGFFYVSYRMGQPKIFVSSLKEGVGRRFSFLRGNQLMPVVSRQRDQVAFICDVGGNPDVFLLKYNAQKGMGVGKPRQIFTALRGTQATPTFSPDGHRIAFVSNKDGAPRIYAMEIPDEGMKLENVRTVLITKQNRENTSPAWSPDGMKLAYSSMTGGTRQIWIYDFSTNEEIQITHGDGHKENPTWAPNSLHIAFNAGDENTSELYLVNLNQPEAVKISSGSGEKRFPCWEPRVE